MVQFLHYVYIILAMLFSATLVGQLLVKVEKCKNAHLSRGFSYMVGTVFVIYEFNTKAFPCDFSKTRYYKIM